ncbi:uncharacterized protein LOC106160543 isoform X2 [Lingula anatina]|nr:uncharacterized protein LOC106160543 isoform X2 [Lingula anatina]|eukprot:XP_013392632.1 uncharacterized protein LOC106160543 isoform X2 [Lingula anatina]
MQLQDYSQYISASPSPTQCKYCRTIFLPENSHYRIAPKVKITKKIHKLSQRAQTNTLGKYQKHLLKCYQERKSIMVISCLVCGRKTKISCPQRLKLSINNVSVEDNVEQKLSKSAKKKLKMKMKRKKEIEAKLNMTEDFVTSTPKLLDVASKKKKKQKAANHSREAGLLDNLQPKGPVLKLFSEKLMNTSDDSFTKSLTEDDFQEVSTNDTSNSNRSALTSLGSVEKSKKSHGWSGSPCMNQKTESSIKKNMSNKSLDSSHSGSFLSPRAVTMLSPQIGQSKGKNSSKKKNKGKAFHSQLNRMLANEERKKSSSSSLSDFLSSI